MSSSIQVQSGRGIESSIGHVRLTALVITMLASGFAYGKNVDVYFLTGQSNSLGTTQFEGTSPTQYGPGVEAADAQSEFFWSNVPPSNSQYPPNLLGDSAGEITHLQMQQGEGVNPMFWGPEFGFARQRFSTTPARNTLIVKASRGGGGNTFWDRAAFQGNPNAGHMWGHLRDTADAALSEIVARGDSFTVRGLMYLQGESNSGSEAALTSARLQQLIDNLKLHVNGTYPGTANNMRTVVGEIAASQSSSVRRLTTEQQMNLAQDNPAVAFVDTRDLPLKQDGIHFGKAAKLDIGWRFAHAFSGKQLRLDSFDSVTMAPDARTIVFEDFQPDGNGTVAGPNLVNEGRYRGFVEGSNGQMAAPILVAGSDNQVVFADYSPAKSLSAIVAGGYDFPANGLPADWSDSGESVEFTFVNPAAPEQKAAVSSVAFRLWSFEDDAIRARFLDETGKVLHEAPLWAESGEFAFSSVNSFTGEPLSNIHKVVFEGAANTLWGIGTYDPPPPRAGGRMMPVPDFGFRGLRIVPEPGAAMLLLLGFLGLAGLRPE